MRNGNDKKEGKERQGDKNGKSKMRKSEKMTEVA